MGPYSSGDKSMKTSYDIQEDKELESKELPLSRLQDLYWPSWFHKLTFTFLPSLTIVLSFKIFYIYIYAYFTF